MSRCRRSKREKLSLAEAVLHHLHDNVDGPYPLPRPPPLSALEFEGIPPTLLTRGSALALNENRKDHGPMRVLSTFTLCAAVCVLTSCGGSAVSDGDGGSGGSAGTGGTVGAAGASGAAGTGGAAGYTIGDPGTGPTPAWVVEDPFTLQSPDHTIRLEVFPGDCPDKGVLAEGTATGAILAQVLPDSWLGASITVQGLDASPYCFSATAVSSSCEVVGFGATPADLSHHEYITTAINDVVDPPRGGCVAGFSCQDAFCKLN